VVVVIVTSVVIVVVVVVGIVVVALVVVVMTVITTISIPRMMVRGGRVRVRVGGTMAVLGVVLEFAIAQFRAFFVPTFEVVEGFGC